MSSFFVYESFCAAFMCLQFEFVNFWRKDFGAKAAHKMLVKLTQGHPVFSRIADKVNPLNLEVG
jgi:hypothetical protein